MHCSFLLCCTSHGCICRHYLYTIPLVENVSFVFFVFTIYSIITQKAPILAFHCKKLLREDQVLPFVVALSIVSSIDGNWYRN